MEETSPLPPQYFRRSGHRIHMIHRIYRITRTHRINRTHRIHRIHRTQDTQDIQDTQDSDDTQDIQYKKGRQCTLTGQRSRKETIQETDFRAKIDDIFKI